MHYGNRDTNHTDRLKGVKTGTHVPEDAFRHSSRRIRHTQSKQHSAGQARPPRNGMSGRGSGEPWHHKIPKLRSQRLQEQSLTHHTDGQTWRHSALAAAQRVPICNPNTKNVCLVIFTFAIR